MKNPSIKAPEPIDHTRYRQFSPPLKVAFISSTIVGLGVAIFHLFHFNLFGRIMLDTAYFYLLFALFLSLLFLLLPMRKKDAARVPWYDVALALLAFAIAFYFFLHSWQIDRIGWVPPQNMLQFSLAFVYVLLILEGGRRMAGWVFTAVCILAIIYPMVADQMPGLLWGKSFSFIRTMTIFTYSPQGVIGLPGQLFGNILLGFLVFAGVMISTGAGDFFLKLAISLLGRYRGGPAKVAVVGSAFFGSLSGSAAANIVSTGTFTIPAMKRLGYPPEYAAAIEACASTGGIIMPPVMGAIGFIMAYMINVEYGAVLVAAAVPAVLYYYGLLMGVDAYAGKAGLKGLPPEEIPSLRQTLKEGWPYLTILVFLTWGLVWMRWETKAPFYASALMILLSFLSRKTMLTPRRFINIMVATGRLLAMTMGALLPLGIIIAGTTVTGAVLSMTSAVITLGQGNVVIVLILGVIASFIMGMAGLGIPAYIFLAITLAPALLQVSQMNVMAIHLFIIYYSIVSMLTPPVAISAFIAAALAQASPMKTAITATRLGIFIMILPFFFVFNPALILQGNSIWETVYYFLFCLVGIALIAGALEGYLLLMGRLRLWTRPLILVAGFLIALPNWQTTVIGVIMAAIVIAIVWLTRGYVRSPLTAKSSDE